MRDCFCIGGLLDGKWYALPTSRLHLTLTLAQQGLIMPTETYHRVRKATLRERIRHPFTSHVVQEVHPLPPPLIAEQRYVLTKVDVREFRRDTNGYLLGEQHDVHIAHVDTLVLLNAFGPDRLPPEQCSRAYYAWQDRQMEALEERCGQ